MRASSRSIRCRPLLVAGLVGAGLLASGPGEAAPGTVSISWDACAPVVTDEAATTDPMSIFVSVVGNDDTHNAYQVRFILDSAAGTVPDAWRFDADGCQGGSQSLLINHLPPAHLAKACPPFQGSNSSVQIRDYSLVDSYSFLGTPVRGVLANTYVTGETSDPAQRYFLAEFRFDHIWSVEGPGTPGATCGGRETPLCILLLTYPGEPALGATSYIRKADGYEHFFDVDRNPILTVNGLAGCPAVPAAPATWGHIKSAYRR